MIHLKKAILIKVGFIILINSFLISNAQNLNYGGNNENYIIFSDSIKLEKKDYQIKVTMNIDLDIIIINKKKLQRIKELKNPVLLICIDNKIYIAKGNDIFSSEVPSECDYFYPIDKNGSIIFFPKGKICLRKVSG